MEERNFLQINEKLDCILQKLNGQNESVSVSEINELDALIDKINRYKEESIDPNFTASLNNSLKEAYSIKEKLDFLNAKVDSNYRIYQENKKLLETNKANRNTRPVQVASEAPVLVGDFIKQDKERIQNNVARKQQKQKQAQTKMEYRIGGELFGFLGAILVLISLVTLGRTMLPEFMQGIMMFLIPPAILLIGELFERKGSENFSKILTAIGVSSGYIAILINYLYMETINGWIALLLSIGVTMGSLLLSKLKNNSIIKIISLIGFYISIIPMYEITETFQPIIISACLLFISSIDLLIKTKESKAYNYMNLSFNFLAVIGIALLLENFYNLKSSIGLLILGLTLMSSFIIILKASKDKKFSWFSFVVLCLETLILSSLYIKVDFCFVVFLAIPLIAYFLEKDKDIRWKYVFPTILTFIPTLFEYSENMLTIKNISIINFIVAFIAIIGFIMVYQKDINGKTLKTLNSISLFIFMVCGGMFDELYLLPFILFAAMLFIYLDNHREINSIFVVPMLISMIITTFELLPIDIDALGICIAQLVIAGFVALFTMAPIVKNERSHIGVKIMLIYTVIAFMLNVFNFDKNLIPWIVSLICTMFTITIVNTDNAKIYNLDIHKLKIYAIAGTLFIFIIPGAANVLISILTILLAVVSIYVGFMKLDKGLRSYGLGVSLIMILKLMLFDFNNDSDINKVVLFLIGGILILSISFIYMQLEKKTNDFNKN